MKDMTDRELLDAIDSAMKAVVAQFTAKRDAARLRAGRREAGGCRCGSGGVHAAGVCDRGGVGVSVYDGLYVALAEGRGIPLVTADERLIRRVSGYVGLAKLMVWVGEFSERG